MTGNDLIHLLLAGWVSEVCKWLSETKRVIMLFIIRSCCNLSTLNGLFRAFMKGVRILLSNIADALQRCPIYSLFNKEGSNP